MVNICNIYAWKLLLKLLFGTMIDISPSNIFKSMLKLLMHCHQISQDVLATTGMRGLSIVIRDSEEIWNKDAKP